jgi:hypothetical protein
MGHVFAILGAALTFIGTLALSFDLLRSKSADESMTQFQHLQDELDGAAQQLIITASGGLSTLAHFLRGYLSLLEIEAQIAAGTFSPTAVDPESQALYAFISENSPAAIRTLAVDRFVEAEQKLSSPKQLQDAQNLLTDVRGRIARRFTEEVKFSQKMKRVAFWGVCLVCLGAMATLVDVMK